MLRADRRTVTRTDQDAWVRRHARPGRGLFVEELERALRGRALSVPFDAHDLVAELDGGTSKALLEPGRSA